MPSVKIRYPPLDYSELIARLKEHRMTMLQLTRAIGLTVGAIDYGAFCLNIRKGKPLDGRIILAILPVLHLSADEIGRYFFRKADKRGKTA